MKRAGAELLLLAMAFLAGLALAAWIESVGQRDEVAEWLEEGR